MKYLVLISIVILLTLLLSCDPSSDNKCATFTAAGGDFETCHWLRVDMDALCRYKGYSKAMGEVYDTVGCDTTGNYYITKLTCCK